MKISGSIVLLYLLLTGFPVKAQEKFTGIIEYKLVSFNDKKDDQPEKMIVVYGKDKVMMRGVFGTGKKDELILITPQNDSLYMTEGNTGVYEAYSLSSAWGGDIKLIKTDSFKNYFGYRCRGYRLKIDDDRSSAYSWVAEDLAGLLFKENQHHTFRYILGAPHVMMAMDMFRKGEREGSFIPMSLTKMEDVPDSLFSLSGYSRQRSYDIFNGISNDTLQNATEATTPPPAYEETPVKPKNGTGNKTVKPKPKNKAAAGTSIQKKPARKQKNTR